MALVFNPYLTNIYHQPLFYPVQQMPTSYYSPQQVSPVSTVQYVDSSFESLRPRRKPRVHRQVIVLPTPAPIYRQVRHRLPTPERKVIQRTIVQKSNGDVLVRQEPPKSVRRSRAQSYSDTKPQTTTRQVNTD